MDRRAWALDYFYNTHSQSKIPLSVSDLAHFYMISYHLFLDDSQMYMVA